MQAAAAVTQIQKPFFASTLLSYFAGTLLGAKTNLYNSTAYCLLLA